MREVRGGCRNIELTKMMSVAPKMDDDGGGFAEQ